jgi:chromosome segregation ATPase
MAEEKTVETQVEETSNSQTQEGQNTDTQSVETNAGKNQQPFKIFETQADFDKHSAGILNSAKNKAEKEILAMLGLKPDEKDKLANFKEAYDKTLTESEKQAKSLEELKNQVKDLQEQLSSKDAIIAALSHFSGKKMEDVDKVVKMAKGLVDENTTIQDALEQVFALTKNKEPIKSPPLADASKKSVNNPFAKDTFNMTEQGHLINEDRQKAREMYKLANGVYPSW